jgi:hypothetical protein
MQALSDDQQIGRVESRVDRLEKKMDDGFAEVRTEFVAVRGEFREDFRTIIAILMTMFITMIFGFAAILLQRL